MRIQYAFNTTMQTHREKEYRLQIDPKMSDSVSFAKTKDRKKNYSESEASLINQYILIHHDELYGLNGQDTTPAQRLQLWQNLTDHVNALGMEQRTVLEIKKRWQVVKVRVKKLLTPQKDMPAGHLTTEEAQIACLIFPHLVEDMGLLDGANRGSMSSGSEDEAGPSPAVPQIEHATHLSQLQLLQMEHASPSSSEDQDDDDEEEEDRLPEDPPQGPVQHFPKISMNTCAMPRKAWNSPPILAQSSPSRDHVALPPTIDPAAEYNGRRRNSRPRARRRSPPDQGWHKIFFRQQEEAHASLAAMLKSLDKMADCLCNVPEQITDLGKKMEEHNAILMQHLRDESTARRAFEEKLLVEQKLIREKVNHMVGSSMGSASTDISIAEALERLIGQRLPPKKSAPEVGASSPQPVAPTASEGVQSQMPPPREKTSAPSKPESGRRRGLNGRAGKCTSTGGWAA